VIQIPTLICDVGPTCSYPHISTASAELTHSGERRSKKLVVQVKKGKLNFTTMADIPEGVAVLTGTFSIHDKPIKIFYSGHP
jgi:hypothetical protein